MKDETVYYEHIPGQPLSEAQIEELKRAAALPITFDEDSPELTPEMLRHMPVVQRGKLIAPVS